MTALAFLAPLFLLGLGFLLWPVLVHLVQRDRRTVVEFPSLMFLERVPYKSTRRRRIRHWLLLLMRIAALAALVAAFARPFLDREDLVLAGGPLAREVVILLDRSYSMGYGDRWTDALAGARAAVRGLGPEDRGSLVFFSSGATLAVRSTTDRAALFAALDAAEPGDGVTRFGPAIDLARTVLEQSNLPGRHAVVVSDFQRAGWDGDEGARLPPGATVDPVVVGGPYDGDIAVGRLLFRRTRRDGLERIETMARIVHSGEREEAADLEVALELDGRPAGSARVSLAPNSSAMATLPAFTLSEAFTRGAVRVIPSDDLPANDAAHFVLSPGEGFSVLVVEDGSGPGNPSLYLEQALAIGADPAFDVEVVTVGALTAGHLSGRSVVVLNGTRPPRGGTGERLREFVESGGGLVVLLGERSSWPADAPDLLPASVGAVMEPEWREGRGGTLGRIDYTHPVFALFAAPRSGDLTDASFFRYRNVEPSDAAGVLARFDNGAVALAERRVGQGRVLLWTSILDNYWNDMVLQPIFLPFAHQLAKYAGRFRPPTPSHTVGDVLNLSGAGDAGEADRLLRALPREGLVALSPSNRSIDVDEGGVRPGFLALAERGFYALHGGGQDGGPGTPALAVNVDLEEADLDAMDAEEFVGAIASRSAALPGAAGAEPGPEDKERRQGFWWYLLAAAFLLLALETVVSNHLSRRAASHP